MDQTFNEVASISDTAIALTNMNDESITEADNGLGVDIPSDAQKVQENEEKEEATDTALELSELREKVRELNERLLAQAEESQRISEQLGEFYDVFPNADIKTLPDSVWESVRAGNSLAASYALYRQRVYQRKMEAKSVNERNIESSSGRVGSDSSREYFTPDEVRSMSRAEVKANYSKIIESMKKWN